MVTHSLIIDHPFAAITDEEGRFGLPELPAGEHVLRVWHERTGFLNARLKATVKLGPQITNLELAYPVDKFKFQ